MDQKLLRSGQLARMSGVSPDLLRHYERIGVLPAAVRASNGYRLYPPQSVMRVRAVRSALAEEKLHHVEQSLTELRALRRQIRETLRLWDQRLAETGKGRRAELLESLGEIQRKPKTQKPTLTKGLRK
jgi:DNA-binding transcriptional MerR regulator